MSRLTKALYGQGPWTLINHGRAGSDTRIKARDGGITRLVKRLAMRSTAKEILIEPFL